MINHMGATITFLLMLLFITKAFADNQDTNITIVNNTPYSIDCSKGAVPKGMNNQHVDINVDLGNSSNLDPGGSTVMNFSGGGDFGYRVTDWHCEKKCDNHKISTQSFIRNVDGDAESSYQIGPFSGNTCYSVNPQEQVFYTVPSDEPWNFTLTITLINNDESCSPC